MAEAGEEQVEGKTQSSGSTAEATEGGLASLRKTIEALDSFEARWKDVQRRFGEALSLSLSSAFGVQVPCTLTEEEKLSVFGGKPTLANLCRKLKEGCYHRVIVMVGAGLSVAAGIPDFRSPGSGLLESLDLERYQVPSARAVLDIDFFRQNPKPFFMLAKEVFYSREYKPTMAHYFIKLLSNMGLLLRCYTQNIDGLEESAGIPKSFLVQAHGTFQEATCTNPGCGKEYPEGDMKKVVSAVMADKVPTCDACTSGVVKPNVVLFGEDLPKRFKELLESDFGQCDLLIVMGTSLQVQPFCSLVQRVKQTTPRMLINKARVGPFMLEEEGGYRDVAMLEECDNAVRAVCKHCGWSQELEALSKGRNAGQRSRGAVGGGKTSVASSSKGGSRSGNKEGPSNSGTTGRTSRAQGSAYQTKHHHTHPKRTQPPPKK